ncbi:hypothetical protein ACLKA7_011591 [Drosophila subpalustris]
MFTRNKSEFLRRYITMDETWIHHFTPESNRQSAEWHAAGESRPKRPKTQQLAGKVMASVFWDAHGIIFIDYLQKGQTISSDYYMALLERLKYEIAKKRPHMAKKKVLFHQDNAPCHKSMKTMAKLNELGFELLPHPPYSPDLIKKTSTSVSSCCVLNIKEAFTTFGSATILHMYVYVHTTHCYYML